MEEIRKVRQRAIWLIIIMIFILFFAIIFSLHIGRFSISPKELWAIFLGLFNVDIALPSDQAQLVLWRIRLPRIIAGILVGGGLAVSGAAFQALFKNPMASSNVLGVNQGAALGAALGILFFLPNYGVILLAFIFGLLSVGLTYFISSRFPMERTLGLVLSGMVVGAWFQAGVSYIKMVADPENVLPTITYWLLGSLSSATWTHVKMIISPMVLGLVTLFIISKQLNLLTLGDDKAQTLGVNLKSIRLLVIIGATLLTSSSVAISGMIGWVSLVIPHMCRALVGSDYRYLIPCSAIMGAAFMVIVDTIARTLTSIEIPIGILTAIIGGPVFVLLLMKGRKGLYVNR